MTRALCACVLVLSGCDFSPGFWADVDAATPDAGVRELDAEVPDGGIRTGSEYDNGLDPAAATAACFNEADDNADGLTDCEDVSCRIYVPACCVGASATECCEPSAPTTLPLDACIGSVDACADVLAVADYFGSPIPEVGINGDESEPPTLVPRGATNDSGLVFRGELDPRTNAVTIEATIAASHLGHAQGSDAVGVGLVEASSGLTRVAPAVAFLVSGNRGELSLLLAGEVVSRWPLEDDLFHTYALGVRPDGAVVLRRDGVAIGSASLPLEHAMRTVVYGRTFNPAAGDPHPARVRALQASTAACDVPSAWSASGLSVLPSPSDVGWDAVSRVSAPSVVRYVENTENKELMALSADGEIYLASRASGTWQLLSPLGTPALRGSNDWSQEGLSDPELRWTGSTLELWFTGWGDRAGTVARVRANTGTQTFEWANVETVFVPGSSVSYSQAAPFETDFGRYLLVRVREGSDDSLVLYRENGSAYDRLGTVRSSSPDDLFAPDRDEIADPTVVRAGGVYRLFFAGRRGLRWTILLLVSPDGERWLEPERGVAIFEGSGGGFDALGARDPAPVIDTDDIELFYAGFDGSRTRIGVAFGAPPPAR